MGSTIPLFDTIGGSSNTVGRLTKSQRAACVGVHMLLGMPKKNTCMDGREVAIRGYRLKVKDI
jgi:hypothetical protein